MKKKLFLGLLAAAAVSFTACQKDEVLSEVPQDNAISFSTYLGRNAQTKGAIVETEELKTQGFGVFAYYTGATAAANYTFTAAPNFMNNVKVYWDNTKSAWKYDNTKYWPNTDSDKISFYAYGPFDNNANTISVATAAGSKPILTYTVSNTISEHMDVLFTPAQEDKTKLNKNDEMVFEHALSRVEFAVQTSDDYTSKATIALNSVSLSGDFYPSGTLNLGGSIVDWDEATAEAKTFTITEEQPTTRVVSQTARPVKPTASGDTDYIMIIPQSFNADALTLNVNYSITYTGESTPIVNNINKKLAAIDFKQGKAYKIIIKIGLNEVTFTASVTPWDTDVNNNDANDDDTTVII